jgi:peptide-methionine (R)-S-oxide reductase
VEAAPLDNVAIRVWLSGVIRKAQDAAQAKHGCFTAGNLFSALIEIQPNDPMTGYDGQRTRLRSNTMPLKPPSEMDSKRVEKSDEEWQRALTPEQYRILRAHGTERAGTSSLNAEHRAGMFRCAACGQPLFQSDTKFDSGTGWPSFYQPLEGAIGTSNDGAHNMQRTEVHCSRCRGHLGHVFPDGPKPSGERYCMNGAALDFAPASGGSNAGKKE